MTGRTTNASEATRPVHDILCQNLTVLATMLIESPAEDVPFIIDNLSKFVDRARYTLQHAYSAFLPDSTTPLHKPSHQKAKTPNPVAAVAHAVHNDDIRSPSIVPVLKQSSRGAPSPNPASSKQPPHEPTTNILPVKEVPSNDTVPNTPRLGRFSTTILPSTEPFTGISPPCGSPPAEPLSAQHQTDTTLLSTLSVPKPSSTETHLVTSPLRISPPPIPGSAEAPPSSSLPSTLPTTAPSPAEAPPSPSPLGRSSTTNPPSVQHDPSTAIPSRVSTQESSSNDTAPDVSVPIRSSPEKPLSNEIPPPLPHRSGPADAPSTLDQSSDLQNPPLIPDPSTKSISKILVPDEHTDTPLLQQLRSEEPLSKHTALERSASVTPSLQHLSSKSTSLDQCLPDSSLPKDPSSPKDLSSPSSSKDPSLSVDPSSITGLSTFNKRPGAPIEDERRRKRSKKVPNQLLNLGLPLRPNLDLASRRHDFYQGLLEFRLEISRDKIREIVSFSEAEAIAIVNFFFNEIMGKDAYNRALGIVNGYEARRTDPALEGQRRAAELAADEKCPELFKEFYTAFQDWRKVEDINGPFKEFLHNMSSLTVYHHWNELRKKANAKDPMLIKFLSDNGFKTSQGRGYSTLVNDYLVKQLRLDKAKFEGDMASYTSLAHLVNIVGTSSLLLLPKKGYRRLAKWGSQRMEQVFLLFRAVMPEFIELNGHVERLILAPMQRHERIDIQQPDIPEYLIDIVSENGRHFSEVPGSVCSSPEPLECEELVAGKTSTA